MLGGLAIFLCLLLVAVIGFNAYYSGQIFPGVSVAGVDLSGMKPDEAAAVLESRLDYPQHGRILFKDGEKYWLATPAELGFFLDPQATARIAYQQGRTGSLARRSFPVHCLVHRCFHPPSICLRYEYCTGLPGQYCCSKRLA